MLSLTTCYTFSILKQFSASIVIAFVASTLWAIDISLRPYLLKIILNQVAISPQAQIYVNLFWPVLLYLSSYLIITTSFRLYAYFIDFMLIPQLRQKIIGKSFELLLDKSHSYYQNNFSGSLSNKVSDLGNNIPELFQIIIEKFFPNILAILIALVTLSKASPVFALILFLWAFVFISVSFLFSDRFNEQGRAWSELSSVVSGKVVDSLANMLPVRLFAAKQTEQQILEAALLETKTAEQKLQLSYFWMWVFYGYSFFFVQALNFYFLCLGRRAGWITIGDFGLVLMINNSIMDFLWQFAQDFTNFSKLYQRSEQSLRTILESPELLNHKIEMEYVQEKRDLMRGTVEGQSQSPAKSPLEGPIKGKITFEKVSFAYKTSVAEDKAILSADKAISSAILPKKPAIFENLSLEMEAGQKVGLVGYSGGGKTTFVNLILRLYDVTEGAILIDGQNIRNICQDLLHRNIAMIPQDPSLFHRSLLDNIRYGKIDASYEEVVEASKKAYAHEFIEKLEKKYDELVGERGIKLSGGQRQRIAIARAILKNAPILILDEATSQLDSITESLIQESLWQAMDGKTTIVIAHRLSTLLQMDRILVFDRGKIVEDGVHKELLLKAGLYKSLWDAQVGGFLGDIN